MSGGFTSSLGGCEFGVYDEVVKELAPARRAPIGKHQAVLYARVSSKEQDKEGFSIPAQLKLLRGYAADQHLIVAREFIDIETAKQAGRANFGEMLAFLRRARTIRVLLVEKTDRLYRNLKDWVSIDDLDLDVHFVKEGVVLSAQSRSSEKFMHGIKVLMAKNYIDNLSEETQKGMREKAEQGIYPSWAPLGYRNVDGPSGKRVIEPDPALGPLVARLFDGYSTGLCSLKDVTTQARAWGLTFRKGNQMSISVVHKILRNPIYMGRFRWAGTEYQGTHEPLVSRALWDRVQSVLADRFGTRQRGSKHGFAFTGLVKCGHCGCAMVGEIKKGRYVYYHCTGYRQKCPEPYTREEVLDAEFARILDGISIDDRILGWIVTALKAGQMDERRHRDEAIARLQVDYDRIQTRLDAMYVDKLDGRIEAAYFDRKASEWRRDLDGIAASIAEHQTADRGYVDSGVRLLELAARASGLFLGQSPAEKRKLLGFVVATASWKDGQLSAALRQPFALISNLRPGARVEMATGFNSALSNSPADLSANSQSALEEPSDAEKAIWLGRKDSNLRMEAPKAPALPLGDSPAAGEGQILG